MVIAQQAGVIDLKTFIQSLGGSFMCNRKYKVKIAGSNSCSSWVETTKTFEIVCPQFNHIEDLTFCCSGKYETVDIGPVTNLTSNYMVQWMTSPNNFIPPNPTNLDVIATVPINGNATVNYIITQIYDADSKNPKSCSISEEVKINVIDDFWIEIEEQPTEDCCVKKLVAKIHFRDNCNRWEDYSIAQQQEFLKKLNLSWSNGSTSSSIFVSGESQLYTLNVGLEDCFSHSASYNYVQSPAYYGSSGYPKELQAPNALHIGSTGDDGKLIIIASTYDSYGILWPPVGTYQGIYGSKKIRLQIYNRWGQLFREIIFNDCGELSQGDVFWDGKDQYGNFVQEGVYVYKLAIETCTGGWEPYCNSSMYSYLPPGTCLDYCFGHIPGKPWWTIGWYCCASYEGSDCAYKITAFYE